MAPSAFRNTNNRYYYNASLAAACLFAVLFAIVTAIHIFQVFRYKTKHMLVLVVALGIETLGYVTRVVSIKNPKPLVPFAISQTASVVAPAFIAATAYIIVGHMIAFVGNKYSFIGHTRLTKTFVGADILSILTQAMGAAILSTANGDIQKMKRAKAILLFGLALQVIVYGIFLFVAIFFNLRSYRAPEMAPFAQEMRRLRPLWIVFYVSGLLITARSIFRTVEFGEIKFTPGQVNPAGYSVTHEWVFYAFDSVPIFLSAVLFALCHPGRFLPSQKGLRIDGTYEPQFSRRRYLCCGPRKEKTAGPQSPGDISMRETRP